MDERLRDYLDRLHADGVVFDERQPDRRSRRRNLEPDSANLLWILSVAMGARVILEIGTSNGYSTMWLADAARQTGGRVTSVDIDGAGQSEARRHLMANGLESQVSLVASDAAEYLTAATSSAFDLLFIDSERTEYSTWWPHPLRIVRPGGLLVVDNAISHASELGTFIELLTRSDQVVCQIVQIGKGELICCKTSDS